MAEDFLVWLPPELTDADAMPMDVAIDKACAKLNLPLLGGSSGQGWSYHADAQRCGRKFYYRHEQGTREAIKADYYEIGGAYHALTAFSWAFDLGACIHVERGLRTLGLPSRGRRPSKTLAVTPGAVEALRLELRKMGQARSDGTGEGPALGRVLEAERLFDARTLYWDRDGADIEPLAIEWFAKDPLSGYTTRWDLVARVGPRGWNSIPPGSNLIFEWKTASHMDELRSEGWYFDGEVLGEIANWRRSGAERYFGPLYAVVVDVITKAKDPDCQQIIVSANLSTVDDHIKMISYTAAEIAMWRATGNYPQRMVSCPERKGRCQFWGRCTGTEA